MSLRGSTDIQQSDAPHRNDVPAGFPGGHFWLSKGYASSDAAIVHTDENRCDFAALDGIGRMERSVHIGAGQNACAVEIIDFRCKCIAGLHIGDGVVCNRVHLTQVVRRRVEDMYKLRARDSAVHLRSRIIAVGAFNQAIINGVIHIRAVPVRISSSISRTMHGISESPASSLPCLRRCPATIS